MRKCLAVFVVIFGTQLVATPSAPAANEENLSDSGNAFLRTCSAIDTTNGPSTSEQVAVTVCAAYLMGLSEGIAIERSYAGAVSGSTAALPYCQAAAYDVEQGQKVRILLKYIRNNPETAHMATAGLFINAMGEAFPPCPKKK